MNEANGATVTLTASSTGPNLFSGWSGSCSGAALTCQETMAAAKSVFATFTSH